jgi:hypothetical protein
MSDEKQNILQLFSSGKSTYFIILFSPGYVTKKINGSMTPKQPLAVNLLFCSTSQLNIIIPYHRDPPLRAATPGRNHPLKSRCLYQQPASPLPPPLIQHVLESEGQQVKGVAGTHIHACSELRARQCRMNNSLDRWRCRMSRMSFIHPSIHSFIHQPSLIQQTPPWWTRLGSIRFALRA